MQIVHADFDEEDDAFLLKVSIARAGCVPKKPKPKSPPPKVTPPPPKPAPTPPKPAPTPPKPKSAPNLKTITTAVAKLQPPKPKPKEETKQEKLKKRDPFFETEEYEVSISVLVLVVFTNLCISINDVMFSSQFLSDCW